MYQLTRFRVGLAVIALQSLSLAVANLQHVHVLTDVNFDRLTADGTWLVDVWAPWYVMSVITQ